MRNYILFAFFLAICTGLGQLASAQTDKEAVLFTVDGKPVTKGEFLYVYQKNNPTKKNDFSRESLEEYLDLYVNFKLKVAEAKAIRIDTTRKVREELDKYGDQLIKSNFDKLVLDPAVVSAYERMKTERLTYHVMQGLGVNASAEDSAKALATIREAYEAWKGGMDFAEVAAQYSSDPNGAKKGGKVGWITGFSIPEMAFEDMVYNTPVGEVSEVFSTKYGYHFIMVKEERPSSGQVKVQHILLKVPNGANEETEAKVKARIDSIYSMITSGEKDFGELIALSDDKVTAQRGGQLEWFGVGKMVAPFEEAAFALQNPGDISEPVRTSFGWHIIRLQEKKGLAPFEETKADIKRKIERSAQYIDLRAEFVEKVKKNYTFEEYPANRDEVLAMLDSTFLDNQWMAPASGNMQKPVFTIGKETYTQEDLAINLQVKQRAFRNRDIERKFESIYTQAMENTLIEYYMSDKDEDFRRLMQEYRDGIPLFALLEQKVWTAAAQDTAGLEAYYEANKTNYMWPERIDASIYKCADADIAKKVRKMAKKNTADSLILAEFNIDSMKNVTIESGYFVEGQNTDVDNMNKQVGIGEDMLNASGNVTFVMVRGVVEPMPKTLGEARGYVISDYQDELEVKWIRSLRDKYPVVINKDVFNSMVQ